MTERLWANAALKGNRARAWVCMFVANQVNPDESRSRLQKVDPACFQGMFCHFRLCFSLRDLSIKVFFPLLLYSRLTLLSCARRCFLNRPSACQRGLLLRCCRTSLGAISLAELTPPQERLTPACLPLALEECPLSALTANVDSPQSTGKPKPVPFIFLDALDSFSWSTLSHQFVLE